MDYDEVSRLYHDAVQRLNTHDLRRNTLETQVTTYADLLARFAGDARAEPRGGVKRPVRTGVVKPRGKHVKSTILRILGLFSDQGGLTESEIVETAAAEGLMMNPVSVKMCLMRTIRDGIAVFDGEKYKLKFAQPEGA